MKWLLTFCIATFIVNGYSLKLPDEVEICSKTDENSIECIIKSSQKLLDLFKNGNEDFHFPSLSPLKFSKLTIGEGTGAVNIVQNYENLEFHNLLPTDIKTFQLITKDDGLAFKFETVNSAITLLADYNMKGKVLLLPAHGHGKCNITLENLHISHNIEGKYLNKNGKQYLQVENYQVKTTPAHASYHFDNLFDGDKVLGPQMNQLINDNWKEIYDDVSKGYDEALGQLFKGICNKIFLKVPIDDLLKP